MGRIKGQKEVIVKEICVTDSMGVGVPLEINASSITSAEFTINLAKEPTIVGN